MKSAIRSANAVSRIWKKQYSNVHFSENFDHSIAQKPQLKNFKTAFINFFLLSSTVFMVYNTVWHRLEYEHVKRDLEAKSLLLEAEMELVMDAAKEELNASKRGFLSRLVFWK